MHIGLYLRTFFSDRARALHEQIDDAIEVCHVARDAGFSAVSVAQHWVSYPTVWPQPFPILARLAPETGDMRLMTGILLLPLHNPVDVAETVATVDHICGGRLTLGVGLGYRETELEAVGATRKDRVPRLTESIAMMKELWTGEEVSFEGEYWQIHNARMSVLPVQQPHPPIWIAGQSDGAMRRAARLGDACYIAPQVGFQDVAALIGAFKDERATKGRGPGTIAMSRGLSLSNSRTKAIDEARASAEASQKMYSTWDMQEDTMVRIHLSSDSEITDWAVAGEPQDCLERLAFLRDDLGVDFVGVTVLNLPKELEARKEYLQRFGEEIIRPLSLGSGS